MWKLIFVAVAMFLLLSAVGHSAFGKPTTIQHTVSLTWNSQSGASFNVYRSHNTPRKPVWVLIGTSTTPDYTDGSVRSGEIYLYAVSAVEAGKETAKSSIVSATIPKP